MNEIFYGKEWKIKVSKFSMVSHQDFIHDVIRILGQANQFTFKSIWLHCGELEIKEMKTMKPPKNIQSYYQCCYILT